MYRDLPIDVVRPAPDNLRRRVGDVSDIVASIPTHGILEPLVVAPQEDGTYLIVAGHRRYEAATQAGLSELPCVVRQMSDEERTLAALVENGSREDLTPSEEATGLYRLCQAGWTLTRLAETIGRTRKHVSGRLALLELPAAVRNRVDKGELAIADAAELLKAKDQPEAFKALCAQALAGEVHDVKWAVTRALEEARRQAKRIAAIEALAAKGVAVVDNDSWGVPRDAGMRIGAGHDELDIDPKVHVKEPCHAVLVDREAKQQPLCTDPTRHAKRGPSAIKVERPKRSESPGEAERKAHHRALRASAAARQAQLGELLERRLPRADLLRLVFGQFVRATNQAPAKLACELLGLEAPPACDDTYGGVATGLLLRHAGDSDARLAQVALAVAFALAEERMSGSYGHWGSTEVTAHFRFLTNVGYTLSEFEEAELARAADWLKEEADRRRRWAEQRAGEAADGDVQSIDDTADAAQADALEGVYCDAEGCEAPATVDVGTGEYLCDAHDLEPADA